MENNTEEIIKTDNNNITKINTKHSREYSINYFDIIKGIIVAIFSSVITFIYNSLQTNGLHLDINKIVVVALSAFVGYLGKQLITDNQGELILNKLLCRFFKKNKGCQENQETSTN